MRHHVHRVEVANEGAYPDECECPKRQKTEDSCGPCDEERDMPSASDEQLARNDRARIAFTTLAVGTEHGSSIERLPAIVKTG
jgi:hypothetical protein